MVERRDDLDVRPAGQRQDEVAGAEPRMQAPVAERCPERGADALDGVGQVLDGGGVRDVVQMHGPSNTARQRRQTPRIGRRHLSGPLPDGLHTQWRPLPQARSPRRGWPGRAPAGRVDRVGRTAARRPSGGSYGQREAGARVRRVRWPSSWPRTASRAGTPGTCSRRATTSPTTRASATPRRAARRSPTSTATPGSCATGGTRSSSWPAHSLHRGQLPAAVRRAPHARSSSRPSRTTSGRTRCSTRICAGSSTAFRATPTRCRCCPRRCRRCRPSTRTR